ncbi:hypothetical protein DR950_41780 [Kitasatospora xanthocidica]|uniref:Uncharacterized protein n=1 Tax=Kitasatospora xanthocidica TaxID=83382 RepID=A0A372ZHU2_9ACTN|nr:hypothetical protein [Kitasatospora xanthocidica]RGD55396.1 hypothetical protein DR950_41780 [Kitasatospora xanthocidica]
MKDNLTGPDFVPAANRRAGLYVRTFQVAEDGERYGDSGLVLVDSDPDPLAYHPDATWPTCRCPRHRTTPSPGLSDT